MDASNARIPEHSIIEKMNNGRLIVPTGRVCGGTFQDFTKNKINNKFSLGPPDDDRVVEEEVD